MSGYDTVARSPAPGMACSSLGAGQMGEPVQTRRAPRGRSPREHGAPMPGGIIEFSPYRLDLHAGRLWRGSHPVALRPKAWALLCYLVARPGALITKEELHAAIWADAVVSDDTLTQTVGELRRALREDAAGAALHRDRAPAGGSASSPRCSEPRRGRAGGVSRRARACVRPRAPPSWDGTRSSGRSWHCSTRRPRAIARSSSSRGSPGSARARSSRPSSARCASSDRVLFGYGQCIEQYGEREPYMAVLEALERLSHGPSGDRCGPPCARSLRAGWRGCRPSRRLVDGERSGAGTPTRRRSGWCASSRAWWRWSRSITRCCSSWKICTGAIRLRSDVVAVLAQRPERARDDAGGHVPAGQAAVLDHPIQQVLATLRARRRCTGDHARVPDRSDVAAYLSAASTE